MFKLNIEVMQIWLKNKWRKCCSLEFDKSLDRSCFCQTYEIRTSRSGFRLMLKYLYRVSFFITLDIYKTYFKGRHACRKWPSALFSLKKLLCLYAKGFVTKEHLDFHCWWTEELYSQQPLKVAGVSHVLRSVHHWLVTYWDSCIKRKDCRYNTGLIGY